MATSDDTVSKETLKTITITLPAAMATKAEAFAGIEGRSLSEVFGEALHDYMSEPFLRTMDDIPQYTLTRNPNGYTEDDVPRLIQEARARIVAEETALESAKAS